MHLLSHNGPIDVLVCPEPVDHDKGMSPRINTTQQIPVATADNDPNISMSSIASNNTLPPVQNENNEGGGVIDTFPDLLAQSLNGCGLISSAAHPPTQQNYLDMFECLSPPCNQDDFYPSLSPNEGILELFDLA